jgi:hypothetical protein
MRWIEIIRLQCCSRMCDDPIMFCPNHGIDAVVPAMITHNHNQACFRAMSFPAGNQSPIMGGSTLRVNAPLWCGWRGGLTTMIFTTIFGVSLGTIHLWAISAFVLMHCRFRRKSKKHAGCCGASRKCFLWRVDAKCLRLMKKGRLACRQVCST